MTRSTFCVFIATLSLPGLCRASHGEPPLRAGEILVASENVWRVDAASGAAREFSFAVNSPEGLAVRDDRAVLAPSNALFGPLTLMDERGHVLRRYGNYVEQVGGISDVAIEPAGTFLLAGDNALVRVDPESGEATPLSSRAWSVAVAPSGVIYTAIADEVARVDALSGQRTLITSGGSLSRISAIAIDLDGTLLVANSDRVGNGDAVVRIDPSTGGQTVIASGGLFDELRGIDVEADGTILVTDLQLSPLSSDLIRIDRVTGAQALLTARNGVVWGDIAVVPIPEPTCGILVLAALAPLALRRRRR